MGSRKPVRQWPCEIPIDGTPADVTDIVNTYSKKLTETDLPILLLTATPGGLVNADTVEWCRMNLKRLTVQDIGEGIHFLQEDNPHGIGEAIASWHAGI